MNEELDRQQLMEQRERERELKDQVQSVKNQSVIMERIVVNLVSEYCEECDQLVDEINKMVKGIRTGKIKNYSDLGLEIKCLHLATTMYKMTDGLAVLGSQTDAAKAQKQTAFNEAFSKIKEGTIPDKNALANSSILEELLIEKIIDRAYLVITQKVKSANRLLEAIKKILTSMMITKEIFRKEAPTYDKIDGRDIDDTDTGDLPGDSEEVY